MTDNEIMVESAKHMVELICMTIAITLIIPFALPFYILKTVKIFVKEFIEGV